MGKQRVAASKEPNALTSSRGWAILTSHARVLAVLSSDPSLTLRRVALAVQITERATQRIVKDLVEAGFIERERIGRRNKYLVQLCTKLPHPDIDHLTVGDLITFFDRSDGIEEHID